MADVMESLTVYEFILETPIKPKWWKWVKSMQPASEFLIPGSFGLSWA